MAAKAGTTEPHDSSNIRSSASAPPKPRSPSAQLAETEAGGGAGGAGELFGGEGGAGEGKQAPHVDTHTSAHVVAPGGGVHETPAGESDAATSDRGVWQ